MHEAFIRRLESTSKLRWGEIYMKQIDVKRLCLTFMDSLKPWKNCFEMRCMRFDLFVATTLDDTLTTWCWPEGSHRTIDRTVLFNWNKSNVWWSGATSISTWWLVKYISHTVIKRWADVFIKGRGVYASHMRDEGDRVIDSIIETIDTVKEAQSISKSTDNILHSLVISHHKVISYIFSY